MKNKFKFYEVVEVRPKNGYLNLDGLTTKDFNFQSLIGIRGSILGMVQDDRGEWLYDIRFPSKNNRYTIRENDLISTGIFKKREDFYVNESIKVHVDLKSNK